MTYNKEKQAEYSKRWRNNPLHPERKARSVAATREWVKNNPERHKANCERNQKQRRENNLLQVRFEQMKYQAKKRNLEFTITFRDYVDCWTGKCALCNLSINFNNRNRPRVEWSSLDRRDNTKGYIPTNVAWLCYGCNRWKGDRTRIEAIMLSLYCNKGYGNEE